MHYEHQVEKVGSQIAAVSAVAAWCGFVYTFIYRPVTETVGESEVSWPELNLITIGTLIVACISLLCGISTLSGEDWKSTRPWLLGAFYTIPIFGMLWLVDPTGAAPFL